LILKISLLNEKANKTLHYHKSHVMQKAPQGASQNNLAGCYLVDAGAT